MSPSTPTPSRLSNGNFSLWRKFFLLFPLLFATWAHAGTIAPSTSTLAATSGNAEELTLTWNSAGDDGSTGNLTGNYRIQYATYTASWSTSTTPTNATTLTIATTTQTPGSAQSALITGLMGGTTYYFVLRTQDDANNWSGISNSTSAVPALYAAHNGGSYDGWDQNTTAGYEVVGDTIAPSTSTLSSTSGNPEEATLTWASAGDDGGTGNLTGNYRIQYATYTASWSTSTTPTNATTVTISTTNVVPGTAQSKLISGLTGGLTYYFVLWTGDEVPNWSTISNTTSAVPVADLVADLVAPSTSTLAATSGNPEEVTLTWTSAGDDGGSGNLTGNYRIQYATYTVAWSTSSTPTDATTVTIATTTQVPGSAQSHTVTGLTSGLTYYFVLWTGDEVPNWSGISNTTSAVGGYWFDPNQIDVDGAGGGLYNSDVAWGDFDNDGDLDVLASGRQSSGNTRELRIYKNNGNGTMDAAQIEVDGAGGGLIWGGVAWGDYDSDGDLDVLACGSDSASARQLRIYINNGNGTMNATQIEVDGTGGGVTLGDVAWGDYDNDGDLDTVMIGSRVTYELRVYKNNGNGTMDPTQIEVDGPAGGLESFSVAWGDYDNDGDLDILANGWGGSGAELRIYKNNGNGTMDAAQIDVDGAGGGVQTGSVAWGDYDNDGDLDVLTNGYAGGTPQLRIYKNNGNGTMDDVQIEVDGAGGGLVDGAVVWGDYDVDGDLDLLTNGYVLQLRVYKNNGNGTMDPAQMDLDGAGGGLSYGSSAWGDYDNDGDLDVLVSGSDGSIVSQLRIYKNLSATANTAPTSPGTLTSVWDYNVLGISTATFKWAPGSDSGIGATPANALTYQLEISTISNFTGNSVVPGQWSSPGMGNYLKPPKIYDGNTNHGVRLRYLPFTNTTYYYRVKTVDAGLKESAWSATGTLYNLVTSSVASVVTDLVASSVTTSGQALLTWTAPDSINSGGSPAYDVRYRTSGAITTDGEFNGATAATGEPTPGNPGTWESMGISGLAPGVTYYFAIKSSNVNGTSPLDISIPRPSAVPRDFDVTPIEVDGAGGGLNASDVAWGDYDSDGDLDILTGGYTGTTRELRIYQNNGNGTINATQIEVDGAGGGVRYSSLAWGDYDNDGDLDILVSGQQTTGTTRELRIYKNNGNGTINATQIEVDGAAGGLAEGAVAWGDYDNDGDLDIIASGSTSTTRELRIYKNNGNGTMNTAQIEVDGAAGGLDYSSVAWGDYDTDGDLDVLGCGSTASAKELRIYKNNGNGTMNATQIDVDGAGGGLDNSGVAWGDYDNDGDLDILASGYTGTTRELRIYNNNGNGTLDAAQIEVDGAAGGVRYGRVTWGDYDNDGDLDILSSGQQTSGNTIELRVYKNNGNATMDPTQLDVGGAGKGLYWSGVAWGDYDSDGDLDVLANGDDSAAAKQLRIYKSYLSLAQPNTTPAAPRTLSGSFTFNSGSISVASFTWAAGTDSGAGATVENGLTYDLQISTTSNFSKLMFPGQMGASPRMGSYLKPPKIFNSNTNYGVVLKSTDPWNPQATASYGLRTDTTYYYRVKTLDSALAESAWSDVGSLLAAGPPSTSTLAVSGGVEQATVSWNSAGDDGVIGDLTGAYRIQYATYTASWSTSSTPADATTIMLSTTNVTAGSARSYRVEGLTVSNTYYFVLWSQDDVNAWSEVSNTTSAWVQGALDVVVPSTSTLAATSGNPEEVTLTWTSAGDDGGSGNLTGNYRIQYATYTVAWSTSSTPTDATTVTIATTTQVPGSAQSRTITSLLSGVTYYFVLWSQDESNNWSGISNTTSAVGGYWFDPKPN
ncbi:MAG: VCBS repeat-containing protein [Elusimicrobia bacterium]|nr:VCBS repeat-containing protein [Elusimicrobiota bacterium]